MAATRRTKARGSTHSLIGLRNLSRRIALFRRVGPVGSCQEFFFEIFFIIGNDQRQKWAVRSRNTRCSLEILGEWLDPIRKSAFVKISRIALPSSSSS